MKARLLAGVALVTVVAVASTVHAVRREDAADARATKAALDQVRLSLLTPDQLGDQALGPTGRRTYQLALLNDAPQAVVIRSMSWQGESLDVARVLDRGTTLLVAMPMPECPPARLQAPFDDLEVLVAAAGGTREVPVAVPEDLQPHEALNRMCGLLPVSEAAQVGIASVRTAPGEVVLDVEMSMLGTRPTQLLSVFGAAGVEATVTERLPLALRSVPQSRVYPSQPRAFTVRLRVVDCALVEAGVTVARDFDNGNVPDPVWSEIGVRVQHPGDVVERANFGMTFEAANALGEPCDLPRLESEEVSFG